VRAATPAVAEAVRAGIPHSVHDVGHDPSVRAYGQEAADALGVDAGRVFKTLVAAVDGRAVVGVVPVTGELHLKALAAAMGGKTGVMAEVAEAERVTGYVVGGISPLGSRRRLPVCVDESAAAWPTVFVSAGRRGLELELAPADLIRLTAARVADIARA
jgi:Cys-tRNA(Pro)/Cys-tRNA(Cys) deacylase